MRQAFDGHLIIFSCDLIYFITGIFFIHRHRSEFPSLDELLEEERRVREDMLEDGDLDAALCHLDVNPTNVILTESGKHPDATRGEVQSL